MDSKGPFTFSNPEVGNLDSLSGQATMPKNKLYAVEPRWRNWQTRMVEGHVPVRV